MLLFNVKAQEPSAKFKRRDTQKEFHYCWVIKKLERNTLPGMIRLDRWMSGTVWVTSSAKALGSKQGCARSRTNSCPNSRVPLWRQVMAVCPKLKRLCWQPETGLLPRT